GVGVDEGPRADSSHQRPAFLELAQPCADLLVAELRARATPARVDDDIDLPEFLPARLGQDAHALGTGHRRGALTDHHDLDVFGVEEAPSAQHLPRPGEIELLSSLEDGHCNPHITATLEIGRA